MKGDRVTGKAVWRSSTAAILALAALAGHMPAIGEAPTGTFTPVTSRLMLTRTLERALPDGKIIATRRDYEVRIIRDGDGFRVDGALVNVAVDAPPSLSALAEIERRRPDAGLFPIRLDAGGMIVGGGTRVPGTAVSQAVSHVSERIGASGLAAIDMLQAQAFLAQLRSGAARSSWPGDIFRPTPGKRSEVRTVALAGGATGDVTIEIEGHGAGPDGQIATVDRIVTTDLGGDRRVTRERWRISRAPADSVR